MTLDNDNSVATQEWLKSLRSKRTSREYRDRFNLWVSYCKSHGFPSTGDAQLADMKERRLSKDNKIKYFYDDLVPKFFVWLKTEYQSLTTGKPLTESSALSHCTAVRSFFTYHRYQLQIKKDALPSSTTVKKKYKDHNFDIYQLRDMFKQGDLQERAVLVTGVNLWLRVNDFAELQREMIEKCIKREEETAKREDREPDIIEFEIITHKERVPCCCHLSREAITILNEYFRTNPIDDDNEATLFPLKEEALNNLLKRLADKAKITVSGRIRWHCLRKFGITLMHGKVTEPVMKYMVGKQIEDSLRTYIQANKEPYKAFKLIEPLISLTRSNGNGSAKQLEQLAEQGVKIVAMLKLIEKTTPKETMRKAIIELAEEFGIELKIEYIAPKEGIGMVITKPIVPSLDEFIPMLTKAIQDKELEKTLEENENNHT